jgi:hypothetical protein
MWINSYQSADAPGAESLRVCEQWKAQERGNHPPKPSGNDLGIRPCIVILLPANCMLILGILIAFFVAIQGRNNKNFMQ